MDSVAACQRQWRALVELFQGLLTRDGLGSPSPLSPALRLVAIDAAPRGPSRPADPAAAVGFLAPFPPRRLPPFSSALRRGLEGRPCTDRVVLWMRDQCTGEVMSSR